MFESLSWPSPLTQDLIHEQQAVELEVNKVYEELRSRVVGLARTGSERGRMQDREGAMVCVVVFAFGLIIGEKILACTTTPRAEKKTLRRKDE